MDKIHRTEYNEYHQPVNMERIFGDGQLDYAKTIQVIRQAILSKDWTEELDELFDAIMWDEMSPAGWANVAEISVWDATREFDHAYRALQTMAEKGWIQPVR